MCGGEESSHGSKPVLGHNEMVEFRSAFGSCNFPNNCGLHRHGCVGGIQKVLATAVASFLVN